jgi:serine phosphatase RsbU (regulator of sigma subunit)
MTLSVTTEFHEEFEAARERWLRDRLVWYCGFMVALALIPLVISIIRIDSPGEALEGGYLARNLVRIGQAALFGAAFTYAATRRRDLSRERVLRVVNVCIIALGIMSLVAAPAISGAMSAIMSGPGEGSRSLGPGAAWVFLIFVTHFFASVFIPWTPKECLRPMVPLLAVASAVWLIQPVFTDASLPGALFAAIMLWTVALPGLLVSWLRHSRHRNRFHLRALTGRYGLIKRELVDARRIHESIFPPQVLEGPVRFAYRYEPMLQLGGDYVFVHPDPALARDGDGSMSVVLIDVTGHGIAAALTVNRLDGELHRLFAEDPEIGPGELLSALNRYIHLTLAPHSVYATAFCARVDPEAGELRWANAGHPPGVRRDAAGRLEELTSTTFVLGAATDGSYDSSESVTRFDHGDALLLYTDGAFEARNAEGAMFTLDGLRRALVRCAAVAPGRGELAQRLLDDVDAFRSGPPSDDTLILEVSRPPRARRAMSAPAAEPVAAG